MSGSSYVQHLVDENSWVDWTVEFERDAGDLRAELWAVVTSDDPVTEVRGRAARWNRTFLICLCVALVLLFPATNGVPFGFVAVAVLTVAAAVSWVRAQMLNDAAVSEVAEAKREASYGALVTDFAEPLWEQAADADHNFERLLTDWLLTKHEVDQLEDRITRGEQIREKLSPTDPMRDTLRVEVETLRGRQLVLREAREEQASVISRSAQEHAEAVHRVRVAEEVHRIREEERAKFAERMRTAGSEEQARFEAHEKAQKWLEGQD